ncbi:hypothetical protein [Leekyejoonella antrihumi]|uniref:Uncharacterized protein n=1 Tax=Leekyejoonella antrihumi TaxID=1660198 RepID=A0A563E5U0_9MICO|nr:hypothetical protein [Leekyejoonella antrihumi]TWP37659.1 hypothetical protein FGL98_05480 [Leekyejoonella antrihumi]
MKGSAPGGSTIGRYLAALFGWVGRGRGGPPPHPHRTGLRLFAVGMTAFLVGTVALAGQVNVVVLIAVIVAGLAVLTTVNDLFSMLVFVGCTVLLWLVSGASPSSGWCVPIAVELFAVQSALTLATLGPAEAPVPRRVLVTWLRRTLWVAAGTALIGAAGVAISSEPPRGTVYVAAALVIALMVGAALLPRLFAPDDGDPE